MELAGRKIVWGGLVVVCLWSMPGCSTPSGSRGGRTVAGADPALRTKADWPAGTVVYLNRQEGFVVLQCTVLPSPAQQLKLYREGKVVAAVRITPFRRPPYVAADIVEGQPRKGDSLGS